MKVRYLVACGATAVTLSLMSACATAYEGEDYGYIMSRHPAIADADANAAMAIERMREAQRANDYHLGGHAGRAIQLLQDARAEMAAAAAVATP
ncbi:hypothetical protein [Paraburkholderia sp. J12]|uniref:hypothetical protein n=1 Tax=Paraburkholderia sp. J12 TaxID=2805432 RepID=UPI002ABDC4DA|nr:hypothetical protein [Paraburkholderia sp. J12]